MPYNNERAPRLGHVPITTSEAVAAAFSRWEIAQAKPEDQNEITSLCVPVEALPELAPASAVKFAITVDGSLTEVEATRDHPTIKVGYIRVAASLLELDLLEEAGKGPFVDPAKVRQAHQASAFDAALPGSGLVRPGSSGPNTWRQEVDLFLRNAQYDEESNQTLAHALLTLHGKPGTPAESVPLRACPSVDCEEQFKRGREPRVGLDGGKCPACGERLYFADVLRSHEEYSQEGTNQSAITRVMNVAERLMTLSYLDLFHSQAKQPVQALQQTIFITDGPLALFGGVAPLKRRFHEYLQELYLEYSRRQLTIPMLVGIEKSGRFVEHAELIKELIPKGNVMRLTTPYINKMTARPEGNVYGRDEFYGRRFIYRTTSGDPLVITVPPRSGVLPYEGDEAEDFESYPLLRVICEVLDGVRTRLYPNAVIPVALAHNSAALPLGVGQSVLRALAQKGIGVPQDSQIRYRLKYK
jgi:hypothetical protein